MANASVKYTIMGDPQSALAAQKAVIEQQDKTIEKLRQTGRAGKDAGTAGAGAMKQFKGAALEVVGALGMTVGVGAMISKGIGLTKEWIGALRDLASMTERVGQEATALAMMQEGGKARGRVIEAGVVGARYGIARGPALTAIQALQAQTGTWEKGIEAAEEAFKLAGLAAVPMEAAQTAVSAGIGAGLTPKMAARLPYAAGEVSALSPAELAGISPAIPFFGAAKGGPGEAYGFAAALSKTFKDELTTYTRAVGVALTAPPTKGKWGRFVSKLPGYEEGDFLQMLEALEERGLTTTKALGTVGLNEKRQSAGLAEVMRDLGETERILDAVRTTAAEPMLIERRRAGAEVGFPEMTRQREIAERRARGKAVLGMPVTPEARAEMGKAMGEMTERQIRAEAMARAGYGAWIADREQMEAGWMDELKAQIGDNWRLVKHYGLGKMPPGGRHAPYTFRQAFREIEAEEARSRNARMQPTIQPLPPLPLGAAPMGPEPAMPAGPAAVEVPGVMGALRAPAQQAAAEARAAGVPATEAIREVDERAEQRHEESVGVLKDIRDGLNRLETSQRIDTAPEKPER